jgi:hypothetical protein
LDQFLTMVKEFCVEENEMYIAERSLDSDRVKIWKDESKTPPILNFVHSWFTEKFSNC